MQTKAILELKLFLILMPAVIFFFTEYKSLPLGERVFTSLFQSVTPRTAGFNTTDTVFKSGETMLVVGRNQDIQKCFHL